MSTSNTHQQSLADVGSETRPSMLERSSYIPWASRFRRYLNRKRENRKWLNKAIDEGPYKFRIFTPFETEAPRMQKEEDLRGDDLKHYEAKIEALNLILISILNDIYNFVDACTNAKSIWQRVECLMRGTVQNKVDRETRFNNEFDQFIAKPGEALVSVYNLRLAKRLTEDSYDDLFDYLQQCEKLVNASRAKKLEKSHDPLALVTHTDAIQNNFKDLLTLAMILLARAITRLFSNPTNNHLRTSSNTRNQAIVQANVQCYNCSEKGHYARNFPKPRVRDSMYFMEQMLLAKQDEAGVILTDDALRMEEIEEISANICLMARIQLTNYDSDEGLSYDYAFLSEVQTPSTNYVNPLFAKDAQEQKYLKQPKIINNTIGDDQIDSNIIFDEPNGDVNSGSVEYDNNVQESYALEQLDRNAYKEAEKQQIIAKKDFIEIQEGIQKRIDILENDVQRCQKQSLDFELQLQHEKERRKCESSLKNVYETSWISKMEKLESENVSLEFQVQSLIKERENVKTKYLKLFDSIKRTRTQTQGEINELIENFNQETYAYADVRAQNQDLLIIIYELKAKLKNVEQGLRAISSVRRPSNRDSSFKNSVLFDTKNSLEKVEVSDSEEQGDDLLTRDRESNLYTISISNMAASSHVCLMSKATSTKSWLWHRRLSHLNFGTINDLTKHDLVDGLPKFKYGKDHLCSTCERGKSKKASYPPKVVPYETPEIIKNFIARVQLNYNAKVCKIRTDNGTEFKNVTLVAHYDKLGIMQKNLIAHTPQQNGVVERRNHTLVEAVRTMLIFLRLPEFL
ncbi:integrase, catalytic region, zinc finger, CCHC-type containing protein [Tanacetum coccineum]